MDVDPYSVTGEAELNYYMRVQQLSNDADPLRWWKQHQQEFLDSPRRMTSTDSTCQYQALEPLLGDSSVVWDFYGLTCAGAFWTPP